MHTETVVRIRGRIEAVFEYACQVENWPRWLPHYRAVRVIEARDHERIVEMRARRNRIPVWWWARQTVLPDERRILYTHLRGLTRGMEVEWRVEQEDGGSVAVRVVHDLELRWPVIGRPVAEWIIGPRFVEPIAGATLACIKRLVESRSAEALSHAGGGGR